VGVGLAAIAMTSWVILQGCVGDDSPVVTVAPTPDGGGGGPDGTGGSSCLATQNVCGGRCVEPSDVTACGELCIACPTPTNGKPSCDGNACQASCNDGFTLCGGACVQLDSDSENCGRCGRSCGGVACTARTCAVTKVTDVVDGVALVVGATDVFVRTESGLFQAAKSGGPLASSFDASGWGFPGKSLSIDATNVYFLAKSSGADEGIFKRPVAGGLAPQLLAVTTCSLGGGMATASSLCGFATDGTTFLGFDGNDLRTCSGAGCTLASTSFAAPGVQALAIDPGHAFWTSFAGSGSVSSCATPGCATAVPIASSAKTAQPALVRVHKGVVYWIDNSVASSDKARILACAEGGCNDQPTVLVSGQNQMTGLAVDNAGVYFSIEGDTANLAGVVKVCRDLVTGCGVASEVLADKQAQVEDLAVDDAFAYWINKGVSGPPAVTGNVSRVGK
jgi:hypothetical protein